ncbi:hypothetical protein [uncultured Streptococcus sp.]|nr:hypothetical protein [uncultured Streptococcus sp.]
MKNKKYKRIFSYEKIFLVATLIFFILLILTIYNSEKFCFTLFYSLYFLVYFIICTIIGIKTLRNAYKNEPFGLFIYFLAIFFIVFPTLLISTGSVTNLSDSIKTFYTIGVGVGINYVIDNIFKFVEAETENEKKKELTKIGAVTKLLFNIIYISEYTAVIILEQSNLNFFTPLSDYVWIKNLPFWIKLIILTLICLIILSVFMSISISLIKKELDMKTKNQTKILKGKIEDELYLVSKLASTIKENNSDILKNLENIESKLRIELDNFNNLD